MRRVREDRAGRSARPGRPAGYLRQLLPAARGHLQQMPSAAPVAHAATSQPVCPSCTPRATAICARCGHDRPPEARWPEGPVCDPCYRAALQHRGPCARCGQQRRLVVPSGPGADTCADCAQIPVFSACAECGTEDKLYEKGRCPRCSLRRRARELLSAGTGIIPAQLSGVFDAVTAARQPRSALNWLRKGAGAGLLADVAAGAGYQPRSPGRLPSPAGRGLPAAHAHRRRGAGGTRRGTRTRRAMGHHDPRGD